MTERFIDVIRDAFTDGVRKRYDRPRDDGEMRAHVSDLKECPRAVWARMRGLRTIPLPLFDLVKFQQGHAMEATIVNAIAQVAETSGFIVLRDVLLYLTSDGITIGGGRIYRPGYEVGAFIDIDGTDLDDVPIMIGHADFVALRGNISLSQLRADEVFVGEVKSERFAVDRDDDTGAWSVSPGYPKPDYILQAAPYAIAMGARTFGFAIGDRVSGGVEFYPRRWEPEFVTADHAASLAPRIAAAIALAAPDAPEPAPAPPSWGLDVVRGDDGNLEIRNRACEYCRYAACSLNRNPLRARAASLETSR